MAAPIQARQTIPTSIRTELTKTGQELGMYEKEAEKQRFHIQKLEDQNADIHDINKQKEVLEETLMMLPDTKKRLFTAYKDLVEMLQDASIDHEAEEVVLAKSIVDNAAPLVA
ncbi:hypothetical protein HDV06_003621 [Boothiomyces sp. JEL0866]|nr:hypothetical protein HDV06_003621 [Boothiomyces sp. JEL0866]